MQTYSNLATLLSRVIVQAALASPDPMTALRLALLAREMRVTGQNHVPARRPRLVPPEART